MAADFERSRVRQHCRVGRWILSRGLARQGGACRLGPVVWAGGQRGGDCSQRRLEALWQAGGRGGREYRVALKEGHEDVPVLDGALNVTEEGTVFPEPFTDLVGDLFLVLRVEVRVSAWESFPAACVECRRRPRRSMTA